MNYINMNIKDFIDYIITFDNIDDILEDCKTQSEKMMYMKEILENVKENKIDSIPYLITNMYDEIIIGILLFISTIIIIYYSFYKKEHF